MGVNKRLLINGETNIVSNQSPTQIAINSTEETEMLTAPLVSFFLLH